MLDIGLRVSKLDSSNMKDVYYTPADTPIQQTIGFDELVDNIKWDERHPKTFCSKYCQNAACCYRARLRSVRSTTRKYLW